MKPETAIERLELHNWGYVKETTDAINEGIAALEKQIPQKPVYTCNREIIHCPSCDYDLMGGVGNDEEIIHCWNCGQKLDW